MTYLSARLTGDNPAPKMTSDEKARVRKAAIHVNRLYPGPAGVILYRELMEWELYGWRLAHDGPISQLVDDILEHLETAA